MPRRPPPSPFGQKGPENALVPSAPTSPSREERYADGHLLDQLGLSFLGERSELRSISDAEFCRLTGGSEGLLDEMVFTEGVGMSWGLTREAARACFLAGDRDMSGRINKDEYLLLREAFVHKAQEKSSEEEHEEIRRIRLAALFHLV